MSLRELGFPLGFENPGLTLTRNLLLTWSSSLLLKALFPFLGCRTLLSDHTPTEELERAPPNHYTGKRAGCAHSLSFLLRDLKFLLVCLFWLRLVSII